jgi:hypothetical protein
LITSRAPMLDLIDFRSYRQRPLPSLGVEEGRDLLRKVGVKGKDAKLEQFAKDWQGYAIVLSLLGAYLVDRYDGRIQRIKNLPEPGIDDTKEDRIQRILRRYDQHLTQAEREFLTIFSAFRIPIFNSNYKFKI